MSTGAPLLFVALAVLLFARVDAYVLFPPGSPPAAGGIVAVDMSTCSEDLKLAATTLQGVVNGGAHAEIWLALAAWDTFWLSQLELRGQVAAVQWLPDVATLFARYNASFDTAIVYDPALPASINVGQMLASVLGRAVVMSAETAETLAVGKRLVPLDQPPYAWASSVAAYEWALAELYPRMAPRLLAYVHPTTPIPHHLRDYLLQHRVFTFFVTSDPAELAFAVRVFQTVPPNTPILG
jgi:hypothetical protein